MIESKGPTNTRVYTVAVYFRGKRLAKAEGHSIQLAEMAAAKLALETCGYLVNFFCHPSDGADRYHSTFYDVSCYPIHPQQPEVLLQLWHVAVS